MHPGPGSQGLGVRPWTLGLRQVEGRVISRGQVVRDEGRGGV